MQLTKIPAALVGTLLLPSEIYDPDVFRHILSCFHELGRHQKSKKNCSCGDTLCVMMTGFYSPCSEFF